MHILNIVDAAPHAVILVDEAYFHFYGETVHRSDRPRAQSHRRAHIFESLRSRRPAPRRARRRRRRDALDAPGDLALQRQFARARLPARGPRRRKPTSNGMWAKSSPRVPNSTAALERTGVRYWPSDANFILVDIGPRHAEFVEAMRAAACWCATAPAIPAATAACASPSARASRCSAQFTAMTESLREIEWTGDAQ